MRRKELPSLEEVMRISMETKLLYNQAKERLKNTNPKDMQLEDIYILYLSDEGNREDLYKPEVQRAIIKYGLTICLFKRIDYIWDKQVIKDLFSSNFWQHTTIKALRIEITGIEIIRELDTSNLYSIILSFKDKNTQKSYSVYQPIIEKLDKVEQYKNELISNKDDMIIISEKNKKKTYVYCLIKYYDDIDYNII